MLTDGNILVRGGAGSGKTTIALAKACADLEAGKLGREGKALFLSFARATVARVAEQATATILREQMSRIEINTYHGFAWTVLKSHGYLLCAKRGVSLLLPAQARAHLAGLEGDARIARLRQLFDRDGLVAFDLFPTLLTELFETAPALAAPLRARLSLDHRRRISGYQCRRMADDLPAWPSQSSHRARRS